MAIYKLLVFPCNHFLYLLDILHGNLVARVGKRRMAVFLFGQLAHFLFLIGDEDDLIENNTFHIRDAVNKRHQINRHSDVVYLYHGIRTYQRRQDDAVDIHQTVHLEFPCSNADELVLDTEIVQRHLAGRKVLGKIAVSISSHLILAQERGTDTTVTQLVSDLVDFDLKLPPLPVVKAEEPALLVLLRDRDICGTVGILPSFIIAEVAFRKKFTVTVITSIKVFPGKDVLLMDGIAVTQRGHKGCHESGILIVTINIGTELLDGVMHGKDGRVLTGLGIEHTDTVHVFNGEVDVLEYLCLFATCAKGCNRDCHTYADGDEYEDYIDNHRFLLLK